MGFIVAMQSAKLPRRSFALHYEMFIDTSAMLTAAGATQGAL
jgi:hypothetical protein